MCLKFAKDTDFFKDNPEQMKFVEENKSNCNKSEEILKLMEELRLRDAIEDNVLTYKVYKE